MQQGWRWVTQLFRRTLDDVLAVAAAAPTEPPVQERPAETAAPSAKDALADPQPPSKAPNIQQPANAEQRPVPAKATAQAPPSGVRATRATSALGHWAPVWAAVQAAVHPAIEHAQRMLREAGVPPSAAGAVVAVLVLLLLLTRRRRRSAAVAPVPIPAGPARRPVPTAMPPGRASTPAASPGILQRLWNSATGLAQSGLTAQ